MIDNIDELIKKTQHINLLYVEDDDIARDETGELFSIIFKSVVSAKDGVDALNKYKSGNFDLVITDISMPNMDGIELTKEIKKINKEQKLIILSAYNDKTYKSKLAQYGVDAILFKPIDMSILEKVLLEIIP